MTQPCCGTPSRRPTATMVAASSSWSPVNPATVVAAALVAQITPPCPG